ncbi:MAG: hypothetical protein NTZ79_01360 [Proteobacteria bacterium]|nr:hypothetical protein [Pseudomonadota bacterium]
MLRSLIGRTAEDWRHLNQMQAQRGLAVTALGESAGDAVFVTQAAHRAYGRALSEVEAAVLRAMVERAQADRD